MTAGAPQATGEGVPQATKAGNSGAIARAIYWADNTIGISVCQSSTADADRAALAECAQKPKDEDGYGCELRERFLARCTAQAAQSEFPYNYGYGFASTKEGAIDKAMANCVADPGDAACRIQEAVCGECEGEDSVPAALWSWSAFAVDEDWSRVFLAVGHKTYELASEAAVSLCEKARAADCASGWSGGVVKGGRCAAIAFSPSGYRPHTRSFELADTKESAIEKAIAGCASNYEGCRVEEWKCLSPLADVGGDGASQGADAGNYGAFAIDESAWAFAFSVLYPSQAEADQQASSLCAEEGGEHCEIKYQFTDSRCGAAAVAEERGLRAWGFGHADTRRGAIDNAMSYCKRENTSGGRCRKVAVSCGELGATEAADAPRDDGRRYGAFAIDVSAWAFAFAGGETSQAAADREALAGCAQEGGESCEIKYQFTNRCAAVAVAEEQGLRAWGFGNAEVMANAFDIAMNYCKSENTGGGTCHIEAASCGERS